MDVGSDDQKDDESSEDDGGDGGDETGRFVVEEFGVWFGRRGDLIFELDVSHFAIAFESIDLIHDQCETKFKLICVCSVEILEMS